MFSTSPNIKHVVIANIIACVVSTVMVGAVLYSWMLPVLSSTLTGAITYASVVLAWVFLFSKVHRAIDINARRIPFKQHILNSVLTSGSATGTFVLAWLANVLFNTTLSSVVLIFGLALTALLQIALYVNALRESDSLTTVVIK